MNEILNLKTVCNEIGSNQQRANVQLIVESEPDEQGKKIVTHQIDIFASDVALSRSFDPKKKYSIIIQEI